MKCPNADHLPQEWSESILVTWTQELFYQIQTESKTFHGKWAWKSKQKNFKNSYFDVKNKENFQVEMINSVVKPFQFKIFFQDF